MQGLRYRLGGCVVVGLMKSCREMGFGFARYRGGIGGLVVGLVACFKVAQVLRYKRRILR